MINARRLADSNIGWLTLCTALAPAMKRVITKAIIRNINGTTAAHSGNSRLRNLVILYKIDDLY
jgi:hypothetical protein